MTGLHELRAGVHQEVRKGAPGGATGPRSIYGKAKSSANRTVHGLTGFALVLHGEAVEDYAANMCAWTTTLPCGSPGELKIVTQLGDLGWRHERLLRLEHAHHLQLVEEAVKRTPRYSSQALALRALTGVNALVCHAQAAVALSPFPTRERPLRPFLSGAAGVLELVRDVENLDLPATRGFTEAVTGLQDAADRGQAAPEHMRQVADAAQVVQALLAVMVEEGETALDRLREAMAAKVVPADDRESRRLGRYRAEIEKSQSRLLGILDQVRAQRTAAQEALAKSGQEPVTIRLRVVR